MLLLLLDTFGQVRQIPHAAVDLALCRFKLNVAHQRRRARQSAAGPVGDLKHHRQIPQQFLRWRRRLWRDLLMGLQKQFGRIQNPLTYGWGRIAPGRIEFTGLAAAEAVLGKRVSHALAVVGIGARQRRKILHRHMRRDLAGADALLHRFGNLFDQSQSARHPAHAAIKAARQILQRVTETLLQFGKQPTFFQRRFRLGKPHRTIQHQSVGFVHIPDDGFHRVAAQLLESRHTLVAIDEPIPIGLIRNRDDHDRRLLPRCRQRRQ